MLNSLLESSGMGQIFINLFKDMGFMNGSWQNYVMLLISFILMYLAIVKKFEPMLLLPIAFGMFLINLPGAEPSLWGTHPVDKAATLGVSGGVENIAAYIKPEHLHAENISDYFIFIRKGYLSGDSVNYYASYNDLINNVTSTMTYAEFSELYGLQGYFQCNVVEGVTKFNEVFNYSFILNESYDAVVDKGLLWYLYFGVDKVIYPPLIFLGIGCMTDFGPLIANPKSMLIGAGAQLGIFIAFMLAVLLGFSVAEAASIAIIGGADGPTAIMVTSKLASDLIPMIAIAAYSYMALIP
ncbi:MAG: sodium ion-translocating decarboxylase subunit beta, partial [Clostridia bacterium]|nr:sodium ion-translocating decarboxylase subunit beta [Clostridia bacterium]